MFKFKGFVPGGLHAARGALCSSRVRIVSGEAEITRARAIVSVISFDSKIPKAIIYIITRPKPINPLGSLKGFERCRGIVAGWAGF